MGELAFKHGQQAELPCREELIDGHTSHHVECEPRLKVEPRDDALAARGALRRLRDGVVGDVVVR